MGEEVYANESAPTNSDSRLGCPALVRNQAENGE